MLTPNLATIAILALLFRLVLSNYSSADGRPSMRIVLAKIHIKIAKGNVCVSHVIFSLGARRKLLYRILYARHPRLNSPSLPKLAASLLAFSANLYHESCVARGPSSNTTSAFSAVPRRFSHLCRPGSVHIDRKNHVSVDQCRSGWRFGFVMDMDFRIVVWALAASSS